MPRSSRRPDPTSHIGFLDEAEGESSRPRKKARRDPDGDEGLDLDQIW